MQYKQIGNSVLINGDCYEAMKLFADKSVSCVITDVPYGVDFKNDFYDDTEETVFKNSPFWFQEWFRILEDNAYLFVFAGVKTIHKWIEDGLSAGFLFKNIIATRSFNNGAITPKNNFGFQFQPILLFSKGNGRQFNNVDFIPTSEEWFRDKRNKNPKPYTYSYPNWIKTEWAYASAKRAGNSLHPNEKNVDLIEFFIKIATNENDIVLDSFMGSGTTGVACKNTRRKFIGIELDKGYFELSCKRIEEGK